MLWKIGIIEDVIKGSGRHIKETVGTPKTNSLIKRSVNSLLFMIIRTVKMPKKQHVATNVTSY